MTIDLLLLVSYNFLPFPTESNLELANRVASGDLLSLADKILCFSCFNGSQFFLLSFPVELTFIL